MTRDDYMYTADDQGHSMEWIMAQNLSTLHWLGIFQDSKMIWIQQVISYVQAKGRLVISGSIKLTSDFSNLSQYFRNCNFLVEIIMMLWTCVLDLMLAQKISSKYVPVTTSSVHVHI